MSDKISKDEFYARLQGVKLNDLKAMAAEQKHQLAATSKADAVDEMWALYSGRIVVTPAQVSTPVPVVSGPLEYEGRICAPERSQFNRAGFHFTRAWRTLSPTPTETQLGALRAEPVVQIRIKG